MKRKEFDILFYRLTFLFCVLMGFVSCASDVNESGCPNKLGPAYVEGFMNTTNETRAINKDLKSFTMYSMTSQNKRDGSMLADGIYYSKDNSSWSSDAPYYMDERRKMNAYGISPKVDIVTEPVYSWTEQHFVYTNPTENQTMLKVASKIGYTAESMNNKLSLGFNDAMYTLRFQATNAMTIENCKVYIKGITIHNLPSKAMFTYDSTIESTGTWTLTEDNQYVNYSQDLENAVEVTNSTDIQDSAFVLFPLVPTSWSPTKKTMAQADADHEIYIEVKAQITQDVNNKTLYLWGSKDGVNYDQYESIFYRYRYTYNSTQKSWDMSLNGFYDLLIDKNGYDKNGDIFSPHPDDEDGAHFFTSSEQIDFTVVEDNQGNNVDPWSNDTDNNTVEITM